MALTQTSWVLGHKIQPIISSGDYDAFIGETPSSVPGPPPHFHSKYTEFFLVLKGTMEFILNGEKRLLEEGESIDLPLGCIHTFSNPTSETVCWLNIHSPKGFSSFFETFGIPINEDKSFESSVSDLMIGRVVKEAASFDMNIAGT